VKDYVKKIKQEDARIDMRKKTLAKTAERIAQARAKAAAPNPPAAEPTVPPPQSRESNLSTTEVKTEPSSQPTPVAVASPVHPSLPPKPSTVSTSKLEAGPTPAASSTASVPASIHLPAQDSVPPVDEQIQKFEEVSSVVRWLLDSILIFFFFG